MARAIELALAQGVKRQALTLASHARDENDHILEVLAIYEHLLEKS